MAMAGAISLSGPAHAAVPPPPAAPAVAIVPTVSVIAGTGTDGPLLNNIPANTAQLFGPIDVAAAPNGDVFIADANHQQIRIIGADSKIQPALDRKSVV